MRIHADPAHQVGVRSPMLYGHFIEHFHRQIYGGVYDPGNPLSDEDGFRTDVLEAMRKIHVPILRWPGGCFVSSYHWKKGVGPNRIPSFDKAWRVEEPNTFGTDEYIRLCQKIGCQPYICTNAGTGTEEEMSDWLEYCNLDQEGQYAKWRIQNGHREPYGVKYWSIGNENYGSWEIGAKSSTQWGRLVAEAAKMMKHVDPTVELTAAALTDLDWNIALLRCSGQFLDWISIHEYWDAIQQTNAYADYEAVVAYTNHTQDSIARIRGLLTAMGLDKKIRIAFDEWNLRGWYHPNVHTIRQGVTKEEYLYPRDENDDNTRYTMADAVFSACFLNACNRNCDIVGMANFAPVVNTRGCIYTHKDGIVLRSTYHVFDLYVNYLGDIVLHSWIQDPQRIQVRDKDGNLTCSEVCDVVVTLDSKTNDMAVAVVNKSPNQSIDLALHLGASGEAVFHYISGSSVDAYNDIGHEGVSIEHRSLGQYSDGMVLSVDAHTVGVVRIGKR